MSDKCDQLTVRKHDLLVALRLLEQDRVDGILNEHAYRTARARYENEAAIVLQQIDNFVPNGPDSVTPGHDLRRRIPVAVVAATVVMLAAIGLFLTSALHPRTDSAAVATSPAGRSRAVASARLLALQRAVREQPSNADALLALGNAYLDAGKAAQADASYRAAANVAPRRPEPRTLHAMVIGFAGQVARGVLVLRAVERQHPHYARAWLLDGILSNSRRDYPSAVKAWQRFLALDPHGSFSPRVRGWLVGARKMIRTPGTRSSS